MNSLGKLAKEIETQIFKEVYAVLMDPKFLEVVADAIELEYKAQARLGKRVDGKRFPKFQDPKLAEKRRKYLAKNNETHPTFSPKRSNLTITGELIESITAKVFAKEMRIVLTSEGKHKPYKGYGGKIGKPIDNKKIFQYLEEKGYYVLIESNKIELKINKLVVEELRRRLLRRS